MAEADFILPAYLRTWEAEKGLPAINLQTIAIVQRLLDRCGQEYQKYTDQGQLPSEVIKELYDLGVQGLEPDERKIAEFLEQRGQVVDWQEVGEYMIALQGANAETTTARVVIDDQFDIQAQNEELLPEGKAYIVRRGIRNESLTIGFTGKDAYQSWSLFKVGDDYQAEFQEYRYDPTLHNI